MSMPFPSYGSSLHVPWEIYFSMLYSCPPCFISELWQQLKYSYVCFSMMSVHPEDGGSARGTRVSLTSVDMMFRLDKHG